MQDGYEDALLGEMDFEHISDFTYDISEVISSGNLEPGNHSSYKRQAGRNRANAPKNKMERKTCEDIETPKKYAKYPEKKLSSGQKPKRMNSLPE